MHVSKVGIAAIVVVTSTGMGLTHTLYHFYVTFSELHPIWSFYKHRYRRNKSGDVLLELWCSQ